MDFKSLYRKFSFIAFLLFFTSALFAQSTRVTGIVTDGGTKTNEPMPFVTVGFAGTTIAGPTDNDGRYALTTAKQVTQIKATFIGYKDVIINIVPGKAQVVNIRMVPSQQELNEVEIKSGKKPRYRNKGNPAVELIRQ
ncbi:carboxypeptidase-like regulatory domain-containing protein [Mucilaginibacter humi]|uniref:carboxypeptidase-like regulatory domain-containing protein n=1 Tax=Mucilaginibacter humi TaxID=2732510 RepID=UPI001FE4A49B|nr:carboxypeptidase-like regulatory domain-containing protein [Mucilaginibacter humi]